ncbi:hypothetical protein GCM10020331_031820 [Ectobacillus funiculus]
MAATAIPFFVLEIIREKAACGLSNDPKRYTVFLKTSHYVEFASGWKFILSYSTNEKKTGYPVFFSYTLAMRTTSRAIITSSFVGIINTLTGECG